MALFQTEKETIDSRNSLQCLVQAQQGRMITIDLQNECIVTGIVQEVDGYMNILFQKAQLVDLDCHCYHYDVLYIRGRSIRFVHLHKDMNVRETILNFLKKSSCVHYAEKSSKSYMRHQRNLQKRQTETRETVEKLKAAKMVVEVD